MTCVFRGNFILSSEAECSVSENTYIRTEKERYFSGVRNSLVYLAIYV